MILKLKTPKTTSISYSNSSRSIPLYTHFQAYISSPSYVETESTRRMKRYQRDTSPAMVRSMYEVRDLIFHLLPKLSQTLLTSIV